jgi:putative ABC transport system permease protein
MKNRRRSLITILAIGLGFASINLFEGYVHNTYRGLTWAAIHGEGLGHITIFKKDFLTLGKLFPEKYMFNKKELEKVTALVKENPDVELITPRLSTSGIISNGKNSTIFMAQGLIPPDDVKIRGDITKDPTFKGSYLNEQEPFGVVVGAELAEMLDLKQGSEAVILSNTFSGMANALDVKILGIFNTGISATNDKFIVTTFKHAQDLIEFQGAERLVVQLKKEDGDVAAAAGQIESVLKNNGIDVEIKTWYDLSAFFKQVKGMFDMIFLFIFSIVLIIVVMSVINTMSMSVMERTREIGTMRALGFKRYSVKYMFSVEGLLLGLLGSLLGAAIFFSVYLFIAVAHPTYVPPGNSTPVPLQVDLVVPAMLKNVFFMVALSLAAAFIPARKSSHLKIVDALGHI